MTTKSSFSLRRSLLRLLRVVAVAYLLVLLAMTFIERMMVYPAPPPTNLNGSAGGDGGGYLFEDVYFNSADGTRLHGWLLEIPMPERVLLYFHGNGEQVADNGDLINLLSDELSASVFLFDYRGYGQSAGSPIEPGVVADGIAAQTWLAERTGRQPDEITLIGRSIGGGVAVACAAELGAEALILQCTFSRLTDAAAHHLPWLPVRLVMRNRYDSIRRIQNYTGPVFMSHGTRDPVVPFELGRRLFEAVPGARKQFLTLEGAGHNDPMPPSYYDELRAFLGESGPS